LYQSSSDLLDRANPNNNEDKAASQRYWQNAVEQARIAIHDRRPGSLPGTLQREFDRAEKSTVDWRRELWRFVSDRQSDFSEFDLRHIHRGQYLEKLSIDALNLCVAIDTSASISRKELSIFLTELESIRSLYIDVAVTLYYCDTEVDGPHKMKSRISLENLPVGGGGTSFQPVFDEIDKLDINEKPDCILYFTDGYADFPDRYIKIPTLWVLTNDSHLTDADIPVGTMIRITPQAA